MTDEISFQHRGAGNLLASLPSLLGFTPARSVVVLLDAPTTISAARVDLAELTSTSPVDVAAVRALAHRLWLTKATSCAVFVVSAATSGTPDIPAAGPVHELPYQVLVHALTDQLRRLGVETKHAAIVTEIVQGARWRCYTSISCGGRLPDPKATRLAAAMVAAGHVIYPDREAMLNDLKPAAGMARRTESLARLAPATPARGLRSLRLALAEVRAGHLPAEEATVELLGALGQQDVFDRALVVIGTAGNQASLERLWRHLMTHAPESHRAAPAALLALSAYLRGDGIVARAVADVALAADPMHPFAGLLRFALSLGIPPQDLRQLADVVADQHDRRGPGGLN